MTNKIIEEVNNYYTDKVITHGATPKGVDWNGFDSQELRFKQLVKLIEIENSKQFSILDYGCGFGSMLTYLNRLNLKFDYTGFDISKEMLNQAKILYPNNIKWINSLPENIKFDYVVASGLFNVKQNQSNLDWENYILKTLDLINEISIKGFSFNILTSYSDAEYIKDYLYYASPEFYFKHCKIKYSKEVTLLHDYKLYEFTIILRK